ncbi:quinone-dependent dihydroorotate dehydrogenase [Fodinicola acaciae]|uniref:quinone-dependent dihydroorotate dehydrogenase n=1 Tax=Fodinicola acaciae TaxID=2681555 RepID=UPI0013D6A901|nr:quinone-dependent dihydroorotate dehydrogenase [Fodinicola acaciae]
MTLYERTLRTALFRLGGDPETVHVRTLRALSRISRRPAALAPLRKRYFLSDPVLVAGVRFANRVGLAAGLDKDGIALDAWPALGFGSVEVGTVTAKPQPGNDKPRLFRLPASGAIINRMGFNNAGATVLASRLGVRGRLPVPLGISIGKSKVTPLADATEDYLVSLRQLQKYADYVAINVSSPNTPGLRRLAGKTELTELVSALVAESSAPLFVKVAPDLTDGAIADLLDVCVEHGVAGIIATNTTITRNGLAAVDVSRGEEGGGLSGRPLTVRAREVVRFVHTETAGKLPVIGVGGIMTPGDALRMFDAGAAVVQLYTGFVYGGPTLVRAINKSALGG